MKTPLSLRFFYLLSKIAYWGVVALIALVAIIVLITFTLDPQGLPLSFASDLSFSKEVFYMNSELGTPVEMTLYAEGVDIPVKELSAQVIIGVRVISFLWLFCLLYIFRSLKTFFKNVIDGKVFEANSIALLNKTAIALLVLEVIELASGIFGYYFVKNNFDLGELTQTFNWPILSANLLLALTLWVLVTIFTKGKKLEEEQKLTV
ncbi:MAG: DUF2975 domain-containing protein [Bacteroidia bacterium]